MVKLADQAQYRVSKRGLVLAGAHGDTVLFEHPRAPELPELLCDDPEPDVLAHRLGPPLDSSTITDLVELRILSDAAPRDGADNSQTAAPTQRRVVINRSGISFAGVGRPAAWLDRHVLQHLLTPLGWVSLIAVIAAGVAALLAGRPDLPGVSSAPAVEALLMVTIGMAATVCHEMGHAVTLAHFGRTPQRAGFGFYWGALSFYVDSTPALTLPRSQRVVQALAGLAVDVVIVAVFAVGAHLLVDHPLIAIVLWRLAILGLVDIVINLVPILQVDGHWALADWLDEPDLSPRARRALGLAVRRRLPADQRRLAAYGAFSLAGGITLLAVLLSVFWATTEDLITALFTGNVVEILIGVYYIAPLALGAVFSLVGLLLETFASRDTER
jgi:hypothetical protein